MHTTSQVVFRFLTIRSRNIGILIALSLLLGFAPWNTGSDMKVKAAPNPVMAPSGFLYVLNDCGLCANQIVGFAVDETTGALTPLTNGFPVLTGGNGTNNGRGELLAIDRNNLRLFAINDSSNTVSAFAIDPGTGALTRMFDPIDLGPGLWSSIAGRPSCLDSLLVVADTTTDANQLGRVKSFKITPTVATPASTLSTAQTNPLTVAFSQNGKFVYAGGGFGKSFAGFGIDENGVLSSRSGAGFASGRDPVGYATDSEQRLFMSNRFSPHEILVFTTVDGVPSLVKTFFPTAGSQLTEAGQGVLHPNGKLYIVSDRNVTSDRISVFHINSVNSNITVTQPVPPFQSGGTSVILLSLNQDGTLLFALNLNARTSNGIIFQPNVTTFRVDPDIGNLAAVGTTPINMVTSQRTINGMAYLPPSSGPRKTITAAKIDAPNIFFGEDGKVIVTVESDPPGTILSGQVSLSVDGVPQQPQPLIGGLATFTIPVPTVGDHALVVGFIPEPSDCFAPSSDTGTLVVNPAETITTIDAPPIRLSQNGIATVMVSSPFARPIGNVSFRADGGTPKTKVLSPGPGTRSSSATFDLRHATLGLHTLRANFPAQNGFNESRATLKFIVQPPLKTVTKISAGTVILGFPSTGQTAPVTVRVTTSQFPFKNATGNVSLSVDNRAAVKKALSGGSATFNIVVSKAGFHFLRASFPTQDGFAFSGDTEFFVVKPEVPPTTTKTRINSTVKP